jgi:hypothetical protein
MSGYELIRFVDLSESDVEEYTCSICQDIFRDPAVTKTYCQIIFIDLELKLRLRRVRTDPNIIKCQYCRRFDLS